VANRIVFPHFWNGRLVGWQQRSIPADPRWPASDPAIPKYKNSSGFPKSETFYGAQWLKNSDTVIVVESPMSVAKAHSIGLTNVLATFGAKVSSSQIDLLKGFSHVVLWFDADHAGKLAEKKVTKGLFGFTDVKVVAPEENKDLADYQTLEEVIAMIDSAVPSALVLAQWDREKLNVTKKSKKREYSGRDSFFR
jgi:DNA primase